MKKAHIDTIIVKLTGVCVSMNPVNPAAKIPVITAGENCAVKLKGECSLCSMMNLLV